MNKIKNKKTCVTCNIDCLLNKRLRKTKITVDELHCISELIAEKCNDYEPIF